MSKITKDIYYNVIGQGSLLILGLTAAKFVFGRLGEDALGIIYFNTTLNLILISILDKGISVTTIKEIAVHNKTDREYVHYFIRTSSLFTWSFFLFFATAIFFLSPVLIEKWITLTSLDTKTATAILQVLAPAALSAIPRTLYVSILRGLQRIEIINTIEIVTALLQQLGIITILAFSNNVFYVAYWLAGCYAANMAAYLLVTSRFFQVRSLLPGYSKVAVNRNWNFTANMIYISILAMIQNHSEKVIISTWLPISALGYYGFAHTTVAKTGLITGSIAQATLPMLSIMSASGEREHMVAQYMKLQDFIAFFTVPLFAAVFFSSKPLFTFIFNADIANLLLLPVTFLCIGFYLNGTLNLQYQLSLAAGKPEIAVRSNLYALFILPVSAFLIHTFGLAGAGLSWLLFNLFVYIYSVPRINRECVGIPAKGSYVQITSIVVLAGISYGTGWMTLSSIFQPSLMSLTLAYALGTILYGAGSYFIVSQDLRTSLVQYVTTWKKKFGSNLL